VLLLKQNISSRDHANDDEATPAAAAAERSFDSVREPGEHGPQEQKGRASAAPATRRQAGRHEQTGAERKLVAKPEPREPPGPGRARGRNAARSPYYSRPGTIKPVRAKTDLRGAWEAPRSEEGEILWEVKNVVEELVKAVSFWAGDREGGSREPGEGPSSPRTPGSSTTWTHTCTHCGKEVRRSNFHDGRWCNKHLCTHRLCTPAACKNQGRPIECRILLEHCAPFQHTSRLGGGGDRPPMPPTAKKAANRYVPRLPCGLPLEAPDAKVERRPRRRDDKPQGRNAGGEPLNTTQRSAREMSDGSLRGLSPGGRGGARAAAEHSTSTVGLSSLKQISARSSESIGGGVGESSIRMLLLEAVWEMIRPSQGVNAVLCLEGLVREDLYDVLLLLLQSREGLAVEEEDLLAIRVYERLVQTIAELSAKRLSPKLLDTTVDIMLRYKDAFDTAPLKYLGSEPMKMLASLARTCVFEPGELVAAQGTLQPSAYVVISGLLQISYTSRRYHKAHLLTKLRAGDVFGSDCIGCDVPSAYAASINATSRSILIQIPREALVKVAEAFAISPLLAHTSAASAGSNSIEQGLEAGSPQTSPRGGGWQPAGAASPRGKEVGSLRKKLVRAIARRAAGHFAHGLPRVAELLRDLAAPSQYVVERPGFMEALQLVLSAVRAGMSEYDVKAVHDAGMLPVLLECAMREDRGKVRSLAADILDRVCRHPEMQQDAARAPLDGGFLHHVVSLLRPDGSNMRKALASVNTSRVRLARLLARADPGRSFSWKACLHCARAVAAPPCAACASALALLF